MQANQEGLGVNGPGRIRTATVASLFRRGSFPLPDILPPKQNTRENTFPRALWVAGSQTVDNKIEKQNRSPSL